MANPTLAEQKKAFMDKLAEGLKDTYVKCPKCTTLIRKDRKDKTCIVCGSKLP